MNNPILRTVDYHTAGEPFRIVLDGVDPPTGATVRERRLRALDDPTLDGVRRLLCHEPRGHADMYGCFLTPPDDPGAHLGALFWHKDGFSTACGHGTIALGAWAVASGAVPSSATGTTDVVIDVPSGRVTARVQRRNGRTTGVTFRNVPSFVLARDVPVRVNGAVVHVDVSYGGALYASVPAKAFGLAVTPEHYASLIATGRLVKAALAGSPHVIHPTDPALSGLYGVVLYDEAGERQGAVHQRNVTVFADGEVDRSPCGSATSARLALLAADGRLPDGRQLVHESIIGTRFTARVVETTETSNGTEWATEVRGMAYKTGEHRFVLDDQDPIQSGFVLR